MKSTRAVSLTSHASPRRLPVAAAQSSGIPARRNSGSVRARSARITGPTRRRSISQRREPGSHTPPACRNTPSNSRGARIATIRPSSLNTAGPTCCGRDGGFIAPILSDADATVEHISRTPPPSAGLTTRDRMDHPTWAGRASPPPPLPCPFGLPSLKPRRARGRIAVSVGLADQLSGPVAGAASGPSWRRTTRMAAQAVSCSNVSTSSRASSRPATSVLASAARRRKPVVGSVSERWQVVAQRTAVGQRAEALGHAADRVAGLPQPEHPRTDLVGLGGRHLQRDQAGAQQVGQRRRRGRTESRGAWPRANTA